MKPYANENKGQKAHKYGTRTVSSRGMQNLIRIDRKRARQLTQKKIKQDT